MAKLKRISRLDAMSDDVIEAITHQYSPTRSGEYNSLNWHLVADYIADEESEETDYGTMRITADRIGVLNMNRLVPAHILPEFSDELKYGQMTCDDDGHYCFTSTEYDESTGEIYEVKYGCPTQKEGEVVPSEYHLYVDVLSSADTRIQYRYSATGNQFIALPQSMLLVDGVGTTVKYHYDELGKIDAYLSVVIAEPDESTTKNVLDLQNNALLHGTSGVVVRSYGTSADVQPGFGESFKSPYYMVNGTGHICSGTGETDIAMPSTHSTSTIYGLVKYTTDTIQHIGRANYPGAENSIVARADHTHTASSLKFHLVTYSPYNESDTTVANNSLLLSMANLLSIGSVNGLAGTLTDGIIPEWTYENKNIDPIITEKKENGVLYLLGNGMGNSATEMDSSLVFTNSSDHTSLLLDNTSSYISLCDITETSDQMVLGIERLSSINESLIMIRHTLGETKSNYVYLGTSNRLDRYNRLVVCCGSDRTYAMYSASNILYNIDQAAISSIGEGKILKTRKVSVNDTDNSITIDLAMQDLGFGVMYLTSNTEVETNKISLSTDSTVNVNLPVPTASVSKNGIDIGTDKYTGTFDKPLSVEMELGIEIAGQQFPYRVPYSVYAVFTDDAAKQEKRMLISNVMVSYDYSIDTVTDSVESAYQKFDIKAMVDPVDYTYNYSSLKFIIEYNPVYDSMATSDYQSAGCYTVDCYLRIANLGIAGVK